MSTDPILEGPPVFILLAVILGLTRARAVTRREEPGPRGAMAANGSYVI